MVVQGMGWGKADYSIGLEAGKGEINGFRIGSEAYEMIGAYAMIIFKPILRPIVRIFIGSDARCGLRSRPVQHRRTDRGGLAQFAQRILRRSGTGH